MIRGNQNVQRINDIIAGEGMPWRFGTMISMIPGKLSTNEDLRKATIALGSSHSGCRYIRGALEAKQGFIVGQRRICSSLQSLYPHDERNNFGKKIISRFPIISRGSNGQWSCDGHDKLSAWGFQFCGIRDVWSGYLILISCYPIIEWERISSGY